MLVANGLAFGTLVGWLRQLLLRFGNVSRTMPPAASGPPCGLKSTYCSLPSVRPLQVPCVLRRAGLIRQHFLFVAARRALALVYRATGVRVLKSSRNSSQRMCLVGLPSGA